MLEEIQHLTEKELINLIGEESTKAILSDIYQDLRNSTSWDEMEPHQDAMHRMEFHKLSDGTFLHFECSMRQQMKGQFQLRLHSVHRTPDINFSLDRYNEMRRLHGMLSIDEEE